VVSRSLNLMLESRTPWNRHAEAAAHPQGHAVLRISRPITFFCIKAYPATATWYKGKAWLV